mgnify:FL=1|jgi:hypothetical protein
MANQVLTNALGAFGRTTGSEVNFQVVVPFEASGAISANDLVAVAASVNTDTTVTVETLDVSDALPELVVGVAKAAAADGAVVEVVVFGYAICNIGSTSPALGNVVIIGASDGVAGVLAPAVAGTITGDNFGIFLGTEIGSSNTAAIWFSKF